MAGRPLRVAILSESYLPYLSGVTVSVEALARGLAAQGHRVLVVAPRPEQRGAPLALWGGPEPELAWLPSYELRGIVPPGYRMPWPVPWLAARAAARFRPDVIHANSPFVTGIGALLAARRQRVPLVFTHHTRFADYGHYLGPLAPVASRVLDAYLRRFWMACSAIVTPSRELAAEIRRRLGQSARPEVVGIPTGVDVAGIAELAGVDPRPEAGWPADAVVVTSVGRLAIEKNVELLLDAFAVAVRGVESLRLLLIGSGPAERALRRRAAAPDLAGRVAFTGLLPRQEGLARAKCCDLFLFASQTETQGLVLAEAAACGLPTVALDGPAVGETVRDGTDGILVGRRGDGTDPARLGEALAALAIDHPRRQALASAARDGAGRLDTARWVSRITDLYVGLAA